MRMMASLQKALTFARFDQAAQVRFAHELYGEAVALSAATLLRGNPRKTVFSEQQIFALQRLLVLHARDEAGDSLSDEESERLRWALLWVPDTILDAELNLEADEDFNLEDERWLRFFVGHGGLASHGSLRHELARAHRIYAVIAKSPWARRHVDFCDLDGWLREKYGMSFVELQVLGFGLFAGSKTRDLEGPPVLVAPEYYAPTRLGDRAESAFPAFAAPREWFREEFERTSEHPRRAGFEIQPFLRRPALIQADRRMAVLAPRAIEGWLSASGAYYRFLDLARDKGEEMRERFSRFNGLLVERYAVHVTHVAHPDQRRRKALGGAGGVHRERAYRVRGGESKTSDAAIDLGADLVLIEVTGKRVTEKSLVEADAKAVITDLERMLLDKMKQLGRVVRDLASGAVALEGIEMCYVERIWPIVIAPDGVFQNPSLWAWADKGGASFFDWPKSVVPQDIRPVVLMDLEEYEALMGLVRSGVSLIRILEQKTSPLWRNRDFKAWLIHYGREEELIKRDWIGAEVHRAFSGMIDVMKLPDSAPALSVEPAPRAA
jgi:hypothetical protein